MADSTPVPPPSAAWAQRSHIQSLGAYQLGHAQSISDAAGEADSWWLEAAASLDWVSGPGAAGPGAPVLRGSFERGDIRWFEGSTLNVSFNCLDRHCAGGQGGTTAIIWEGDDAGDVVKVSYSEALLEVCRYANLLKSLGVRKGDTVAIYMPNCPECAFAMLACARIGAIHSVVFAGFSAEALAQRIQDANCVVVFTADEFKRGHRAVPLKNVVDRALLTCPSVRKVLCLEKTGADKLQEPIKWKENRDVNLGEAALAQRPYCPPEPMDAEDPLFLLYTSGSTGKPKGMMHTQAGYLLFAALTHKYVFDYQPGDVYACLADVGWITGHSYIVYGPLCNGATTFMFEGVPTVPDAGRYWDMVQRHKITQFYTAPTAIRALMKFGTDHVKKYDKSTLRVLGTVGEPINPEAWKWYYEQVGENRCAIVDTYWQTESGGHLLTPLPAATPTKPGSATFPFFGIDPVVLDPQSGQEIPFVPGETTEGVLAIARPWPSIARTVWGDHQRYLNTYMNAYKGYYFSGDGVMRDGDGYFWISGRVDDVISVAGHRLGTAEIESAMVAHKCCAEAAVVGIPHDIKGQGVFCFAILREGYEDENKADLAASLRSAIRNSIGAFATPEGIVIVPGLPKTRSGKIMRRVLRKIASGDPKDTLGDISTLAEPHIVDVLISSVEEHMASHRT